MKPVVFTSILTSPGNFYNFSSSETSKVAERERAGNLIEVRIERNVVEITVARDKRE